MHELPAPKRQSLRASVDGSGGHSLAAIERNGRPGVVIKSTDTPGLSYYPLCSHISQGSVWVLLRLPRVPVRPSRFRSRQTVLTPQPTASATSLLV